MLASVEYQSIVQTSPRVSDRAASLEHDVPDAGAAEFPRGCKSRRAGPDDDGVS
jgi:hypothetical protein